MTQELDEILEIVKDLQKKPKWTQWLIPALIAAVVSVLGTFITFSLRTTELNNQMTLERAKMKQMIIEKAQTLDLALASVILEYSLKDLYPQNSEDYQAFEDKYKEIVSQIAATTEEIDNEQSESAILPEQKKIVENAEVSALVNKLDTFDRYAASRELIKQYTNESGTITNALINSIRKEGEENEYRQNLYVAYVLAKIPNGWSGTKNQFQSICGLKNTENYKSDKTFHDRVNQAIKNYKNDLNQSLQCPN